VYNGYERYEFFEVPKCGKDDCRLPIIEIRSPELTDQQSTLKPKILITAGLDGKEISAVSGAMNFIKYIGKFLLKKLI